ARPDVDRDTAHVASRDLDLARVNAGSDLETQRPHGVDRGLRAPDRPRRAVEDREEPVSRRIDLPTAVLRELGSNDGLMRCEQLLPPRVAEFDGALRRFYEVGEQDRREDALR